MLPVRSQIRERKKSYTEVADIYGENKLEKMVYRVWDYT
jgi:hypothetical protein